MEGQKTLTLVSAPHIELKNIKNSVQVKDYLSELVETIRDQKNIIGKEFYGGEYV